MRHVEPPSRTSSGAGHAVGTRGGQLAGSTAWLHLILDEGSSEARHRAGGGNGTSTGAQQHPGRGTRPVVISRSACLADNGQTRPRDRTDLVVGAVDPATAAEFSFGDLAATRPRRNGQQHGIYRMRSPASRRSPATLDVGE